MRRTGFGGKEIGWIPEMGLNYSAIRNGNSGLLSMRRGRRHSPTASLAIASDIFYSAGCSECPRTYTRETGRPALQVLLIARCSTVVFASNCANSPSVIAAETPHYLIGRTSKWPAQWRRQRLTRHHARPRPNRVIGPLDLYFGVTDGLLGVTYSQVHLALCRCCAI